MALSDGIDGIDSGPEQAPATGMLHHVEIYVSDLVRSTAFWGWFLESLGYRKYQSWPEGVSYRLGSTYLVLVQTPAKHLHPTYHRRKAGLNHLAFHARSRDHVDEMTRRIRERGMRILYEDRHPHAGGPDSYVLFFEDPDRIKVELVAPETSRPEEAGTG